MAASYYDGRSTAEPVLRLTLHNHGSSPVAFTVTHNHYAVGRPATVKVAAHSTKSWTIDPLKLSGGWYDVTVTAGSDDTWSQRFSGHLETGRASITG